jgi:Domain of unknown function (DUF4129)
MRARSWRTVAAIGGLLGLVSVVAVSAAGRAPGGGESRPSAHVPTIAEDYLATTVAVLLVPAGIALFVIAAVVRRGGPLQERRARGRRSFVWAVLAIVFIGIAVQSGLHFNFLNRGDSGQKRPKVGQVAAKGKQHPPPKAAPYQPQFRWLPVFVVGSLIAGIGGVMTVSTVRRRRELVGDLPIVEALSDVVAETLDDLRSERDPRQAVIRAYSRMERTLAASGLPRREAEAPFEYLARVLNAVQASAHSVRKLTQLFQRARFSTHEIDTGMKEDAIEALSGLQAELEVAR